MDKKKGSMFLVALGFFLIAVSPLFGIKYLHIISGITMIALGYYSMKGKP